MPSAFGMDYNGDDDGFCFRLINLGITKKKYMQLDRTTPEGNVFGMVQILF